VPAPYVLALNAGSSSLKFALFTADRSPVRVVVDQIARLDPGPEGRARALETLLERLALHHDLSGLRAIGHRFVHGGPCFDGPRRLTDDVLAELERLACVDPAHMPGALAIVRAARAKRPDLPQVACFDTAFHRTMPAVAQVVPIPRRFGDQGIKRYGFHGLSCTYLVEELARVAGPDAARGRVVLAHLGSGSSLTALRDGRSVETTMGFTPTSGVPMGTRPGDLDPGVLLYLMRTELLNVDGLDALINRQSGLLGISATSADVRDLLAAEASDPRAAEALDVYCYRVRQAIGALAATLDGIDTLVFAGGVGENAAPVRARIAGALRHLGVQIDAGRNSRGEGVVSTDNSRCTVRVLRTDEESIIARETLRVLGSER
jgi:acetate kinase